MLEHRILVVDVEDDRAGAAHPGRDVESRLRGSAVERMARDLRLFLCQAAPDAKRTRAAKALIARGKRVEFV